MPTSSASSTSRRLLGLLSLLQTRRDWPAPVLAERLGISERTVRRDVERLRELDYVIEATRGRDGGYRLAAGTDLPPLLLDDEQAVAVTVALRGAGAMGAGIEEAADRALHTIVRLMPSRLGHRVEGLMAAATAAAPAAEQADPAVLVRVAEAIRREEELRFDYRSPGEAPAADRPPGARRVEPHHLVLSHGRWYLIAFAADRDDWRVYRVDRIDPRSHAGARFRRRELPGGDPARFLAARFKGSVDADAWPCSGHADVTMPAAGAAPYVGVGTVEALTAETCRLRLGAWSWPGLAAAFARFDADLSAVEPAELRTAFAALAARAGAAALLDPDGGTAA